MPYFKFSGRTRFNQKRERILYEEWNANFGSLILDTGISKIFPLQKLEKPHDCI